MTSNIWSIRKAVLWFGVFGLAGMALASPGPKTEPILRGPAALHAWQTHLPSIARAHGKSVPQIIDLLQRERALGIDRHGRLLYTDHALPAPEPGDIVAQSSVPTDPIPLVDTFRLHSNPGAARIIYLDFDGHLISGTAWNICYNNGADIVAPPFDFEGGPEVFTDNEKIRMQQIWRRVAEDYAPFEVDVTTEYMGEDAITRSSPDDTHYGMRVLISPISSLFGSFGGLAYVGVFDYVGDFFKPAFVFPDKLGPNGEKYVAEAASHETGHTLGLSHDGTTAGIEYYAGHGSGETGWAPIMGNGYYKNITQWSKGEYPDANNPEDDLTIIASYLGCRADDIADQAADAFRLPSSTQLAAWGIIEQLEDLDVFSFQTGTGPISFTVAPMNLGPNLDLYVELFDDAGSLVAESFSPDLLRASLDLNVNAGTYYLRIGNSGNGSITTGYSGYGSLGIYTLTGSVTDPSNLQPSAVAERMGVQFIELSTIRLFKKYQGNATVYIYDNLGKPVVGASVTGQFSGSIKELKTAVTDSAGRAVLSTSLKSKSGNFTVTVQNVTHPDLIYDPALNLHSSARR